MGKAYPPSEYPDVPRIAVGAVVFKENRVLLVKRGKPPGMGQWAIPGGSVQLGETLKVAAEREVMEETGVVITAQKPVYTFDVVDRDSQGRIRFHYVIIDFSAEYQSGEVRPGDDAVAARWVTAEELSVLGVNQRTRTLLHSAFAFGVD